MILGDLLDARVLDDAGTQVGYVVDVRLALEVLDEDGSPDAGDEENQADREHSGPADEPLAEQVRRRDAVGAAEVIGLLVSPRTGSSFLGYERSTMTGPWPIAALVRARHRGTFLVAWDQVAAVSDGEVTLAAGYERLDPSLDG